MSEHVNFGSVAKDYALWRNDVPEEIFNQLQALGVSFSHAHVADLGCGTGILSREMAKRGAIVTGIDPSFELLEEAKKRDQTERKISYICATAEETTLPDNTFDIITAFRAWHWFDRTKAIVEANRILKPNGLLLVMNSYFRRHPLVTETYSLGKKYLEAAGKTLRPPGAFAETKERLLGCPTNWFPEWQTANLELIAGWLRDYEVSFTHESWCGRVRTLSWYTHLPAESREKLMTEVNELLKKNFPEEPIRVPHQFSVVVLKKRESV